MSDLTNNLIPTGTLHGTLAVGAGTTDYNGLENKPSINNVTLSGNKTTSDLGLFSGNYNDLTNKPTIPSILNDLTDVSVSSPANNQLFGYDGSISKWKNISVTDMGNQIELQSGFIKRSWGYVHVYKNGNMCICTFAGFAAENNLTSFTNIFKLPNSINGYYRSIGKQADSNPTLIDIEAHGEYISVNAITAGNNLYGEIMFYI